MDTRGENLHADFSPSCSRTMIRECGNECCKRSSARRPNFPRPAITNVVLEPAANDSGLSRQVRECAYIMEASESFKHLTNPCFLFRPYFNDQGAAVCQVAPGLRHQSTDDA